jgi:hypothetical protein
MGIRLVVKVEAREGDYRARLQSPSGCKILSGTHVPDTVGDDYAAFFTITFVSVVKYMATAPITSAIKQRMKDH